jgi:hypothetical protein
MLTSGELDLDQGFDPQIDENGSRVILYQDEDDFEVEAELRYGFIPELQREGWLAKPDWSTERDLSP